MTTSAEEIPRTTTSLGRASGKVIVFGEHAVVHGVPAIAGGISRGVEAVARIADSDTISIDGRELGTDDELYRALAALRDSLSLTSAGKTRLDLALELPAGAGLGASAAMAVATARALCGLHHRELGSDALFLAAQAWEKIFHGNPSGVDAAAAMSGGIIRFSKTTASEPVVLGAPLHLVVAQAGPPASTRLMVEGVARMKERNPDHFARTLEGIASLVENATLLLRSGDLTGVGQLMNLNQMLLAGWMLSTEEIERACRVSREAGALGAKLTGAGGGGCVIALAGPAGDPETNARAIAIEKALFEQRILAFSALVGATLEEKL